MADDDMDTVNAPTPDVEEEDGEGDISFDGKVGEKRNITPDGGVAKTILAEGEGYEKPEAGDEVTVHYVGTLEDGSTFDSSRDRGDPFKFTLGKGNVIKGWDKGVATMKKGEKAVLTCRADYAYGDSGSPPKIPGGATLNFEVELLSWKSEKDISGDGGVLKTVVKEGEGWAHPKAKDEVVAGKAELGAAVHAVKYRIRVKGSDTVVAESLEAGEEFVMENGGLIKAFGVALKEMKKGETASLIVAPEYGFGEAGDSARGIPGGATLEVDLELPSWKEVEDVTGDGGVVKKTLVSTKEWKKPNAGAKVTLRYEARLMDGTLFDERGEGNELEATMEEEQLPEGLEQAIMKMKVGEKAEIAIQPQYAFGAEASQQPKAVVPPQSTVVYTLELVDMEKAKESWELDTKEKLAAAAAKKDAGNEKFKAGKTVLAIKKYKAAESLISHDDPFSAEEKAQSRDIKKSVNLNLAAAHLKLKEYPEAIAAASKVLDKDGGNVKALYRRAQGHLAVADFVEAEVDLRRALLEEPANKDVRALFKRYKEQAAAANKKDAAMFSRMFKPSKEKPAAAVGDAKENAPVTNGHEKAEAGSAEPMETEDVVASAEDAIEAAPTEQLPSEGVSAAAIK